MVILVVEVVAVVIVVGVVVGGSPSLTIVADVGVVITIVVSSTSKSSNVK